MRFLIHVGTREPWVSTHCRIKISSNKLLCVHTKTGSRKERTSNKLHPRRISTRFAKSLSKPRFSLLISGCRWMICHVVSFQCLPELQISHERCPSESPKPHQGRKRTRELHHSSRTATVEQLSHWRTSPKSSQYLSMRRTVWCVSVRTRINWHSEIHRGRTNRFYIQHVMCQIHHSQSHVEVCEAVSFPLFQRTSLDQFELQPDVHFVLVNRLSEMSISHVELRIGQLSPWQ